MLAGLRRSFTRGGKKDKGAKKTEQLAAAILQAQIPELIHGSLRKRVMQLLADGDTSAAIIELIEEEKRQERRRSQVMGQAQGCCCQANVIFHPGQKLGLVFSKVHEVDRAVVDRVDPDSQAARGGVKAGWVLVGIGKIPFSREQLKSATHGTCDFVLSFTTTEAPSPQPAKRKSRVSFASVSMDEFQDNERFDTAVRTHDLQALVELLKSKQVIKPFEERLHPWAEDPKTIGCLAGAQLGMLVSSAARDAEFSDNVDLHIKRDIRELGGLPLLVEFLQCDEWDRVQTAVAGLVLLTSECPPNAVAAYEAGAMPLLLQHLNDERRPTLRVTSQSSNYHLHKPG